MKKEDERNYMRKKIERIINRIKIGYGIGNAQR